MQEKDNLQQADGTENKSLINTEAGNETTETPVNTTENSEATSQTTSQETPQDTASPEKKDPQNDPVDEIEASNAEDAEDTDNSERHALEEKDYHSMTMKQLVTEMSALISNNKIQNIKKPIGELKSEFNAKFSELLEEKKEEFLSDGGNEIDFYFITPEKKEFNALYKDYRAKLNAYYKNLESSLKSNLENRLRIIEDIKGLINVEENINTTYKHFKELQEEWRNAGPIPRERYNNTWNTYHHHVEIFYDFLHLNRDLRDMDFKHNLEQKLKIIEQAEALVNEENINRAFRELQVLHKVWKEDLGPVAKENREEIWERFSNATKAIHDRRQLYYADLDKAYEANLERKEGIIANIQQVTEEKTNTHQAWQKKIKTIEALRDDFFNAGKVPIKVNEATWSKFKTAVRAFNKKKNNFYKNLKKEQYNNLQKKLDLIKVAEDNKDSEDFETITPLMKKIQSDWKKIGHVPRKNSDKIWKQFKAACNYYFDRLHAERDAANKEFYDAFDKKAKVLETLKAIKLSGKQESDIETLNGYVEQWKQIGQVPQNKRYIERKFNKTIDDLFGQLNMEKSEIEMIKFENKLDILSQPEDTRLLDNEHHFIRKKIEDVKGEINQLENNLQFFSNVDEDNPMVKDVLVNIEKHKEDLSLWEEKLKRLRDKY